MDIMMRLKGAGFSVIANEFRQREKRLGSGLPLQDFVEIVLQGLPKPRTAEEKFANVSALVDLFEDMDINGDGTMEFDEFTSYCVDAGMVATRSKTTQLKHRYVRNARHVIKTMNGSAGIEKVRWSPLFQRFLVVENAAKSVKLFNADGSMVGEIKSQSTLLNAPPAENRDHAGKVNEAVDDGSRTKRGRGTDPRGSSSTSMASTGGEVASAATATASAGIFILDAAFLHRFQCLAMSTTDFVISFYSMEEPKHQQRLPSDMLVATARCGPSYAVLPKLTITTTTAQLLVRFCEAAGVLCSAGNDYIINVWKIDDDRETKTLWKRLLHHREMIMDIVEIPVHDLLASCDLNHKVQLWDLHDCRPRGALVGHTRGITHMVFSHDHDLLLTAGFEFDAYGWDLASRQVVMKLVGHRAPLVGVQLARFQTERAVTADASGVFKVWDISRATGSMSTSQTSVPSSSRQGGRAASQAVVLESLDPSHELSRFEPTTFISLHPQRRDLWTAASGSATLHLFRSTRVQLFEEIPLKAFYHYHANRFVVVSGPLCSVWDGETGTCVDEFSHVGAFIGATAHHNESTAGAATAAPSSHSGAAAATSEAESATDVLLCVQDAKCKKLVVLSEKGDMGVFNCQNFVQMRRCEETFCSLPSARHRSGHCGSRPPPSCGVVGLHYCSENKLIIATDAHHGSICVIDDSNNDASKGITETVVLRRLVNIPGGVAASAYSYHASMIATLDQDTMAKVSLWDFETLVSVGVCEMEDEDGASLSVLTFWDEFPVLLGADAHGCVYFFAAMPTIQAKTGKLLHAFVNNHTFTLPKTTDMKTGDARSEGEAVEASNNQNTTFITEGAEVAARKFLLKRNKSITGGKSVESGKTQQSPPVRGGVVTCMQVVFDDADDQHRYLLFLGDDKGVVRVWTLSDMMRRLSLFKIPETNCKYLRRGYHPRAMFAHDCTKQTIISRPEKAHDGSVSTSHDMAASDARTRVNQAQLKRLTKQRADAKKKSTPAASSSHLAKLLPGNRVGPGQAPPAATTVAAAEAFLIANASQRRSTSAMGHRSRSVVNSSSARAGDGAFIETRVRPDDSRRRSDCWQHQDVKIVHVWVAHGDGLTSLEVSKHPNVVVTCGLDMRVFIWSWRGACLGKLFDAENVGVCRWRFRKDDSKRDAERQLLIHELLHELELPPQQKATRRRQTLYESHVQRKSQKELPHVSVMLLDHIVSQHPEVAAMEKDGLSSALTDEKINADMERTRQRNSRAKSSMLDAIARASTCPGASRSKEIARMHSLAQVGPLLCVDTFERKQQPQHMKFAEQDELKMDRRYMEDELGIGTPTGPAGGSRRGSLRMGNLATIKDQIRLAQRHAADLMENKVALQRHASAMYTNLRQTQRKIPHDSTRHTKQSTSVYSMGDGPEDTENELEQLLAPSPFLRSKLPERLLSLRPQTAPSPTPKTGLTRVTSSSLVRAPFKDGPVELGRQRKNQLGPLASSASESALQQPRGPAPSGGTSRKSSLDQLYLEELRRQNRQSNIKRVSLSENGLPANLTTEGEDSDYATEKGSLRKLDAINAIIDRAQGMCDARAKPAEESRANDDGHVCGPAPLPSTGPSSCGTQARNPHRQHSGLLPTLHETEDVHSDQHEREDDASTTDDAVLHRHLDATRERMEIAMADGESGGDGDAERRLSTRSLIDRMRQDVVHQKTGKRMDDYLQQKRREMNNNIGAVFKRTSFATAAAASDASGSTSHSGKAKKKHLKGTAAPRDAAVDPRAALEAHAQVEKSRVFGIYGVQEVMSVIRLFWSMDDDGSGTLSLAELIAYREYFEKLGYHDMATVFQAVDRDGSGSISLKELLSICFQYATKFQIDEMLKLAKLGDVATYFDATQSQRRLNPNNGETTRDSENGRTSKTSLDARSMEVQLSPEQRAELLAIFRVFDRNGDGGIAMDEILEALHVEEDDTLARIAAVEEAQLAKRDAASPSMKRRPSMAVPTTAASQRSTASAFTKEEVRRMYESVDSDGDQSLSFEEFLVLMQMLHAPRR